MDTVVSMVTAGWSQEPDPATLYGLRIFVTVAWILGPSLTDLPGQKCVYSPEQVKN